MEANELMKKIAQCMSDKKGIDITVLEIGSLTTLADYFVICSGTSTPHMKSIADEIDEKLSEVGEHPLGREGASTAYWVLLDYGSVIVHIFNAESREFYSIERLWSDAKEIDVSELID